jgi:hypothetical protein
MSSKSRRRTLETATPHGSTYSRFVLRTTFHSVMREAPLKPPPINLLERVVSEPRSVTLLLQRNRLRSWRFL